MLWTDGRLAQSPCPSWMRRWEQKASVGKWWWDRDHQEKEAPAKMAKTGVYQVVNEHSMGTQKGVSVNATKLITLLRMKINWTVIVTAPFLVTWNLSPLGHWFKSSWGQWWKKITSTLYLTGKVPAYWQMLGICDSERRSHQGIPCWD